MFIMSSKIAVRDSTKKIVHYVFCVLFPFSPVYVPNPSLGYKILKATVSILYPLMLFSGLYITNGHSKDLLTDILFSSSVPVTRI